MTPEPEQPPTQTDEIDRTAVSDVAVRIAKQPGTVRDVLRGERFLRELAATKLVTPERFVRIALTTMMRIPELADCSRESLFQCLLDLSSYGLEPDGRRAHLIPFRNRKMCKCGHRQDSHRGQDCTLCDCRERRELLECTLIIDYKGLAELVRRSGDVSYMHADVVYEGDEWDASFGTNAHLVHKMGAVRGGKPLWYYSFVRFKDGTEDFRILRPADVEKVRRRSKSPDVGPWQTDYDAMGIKTAFRQHAKWLPLSPEVRDKIEREDAIDIAPDDQGPVDEVPEQPAVRSARVRGKILNPPALPPQAEPAEETL
jgi:recombination protein RecT